MNVCTYEVTTTQDYCVPQYYFKYLLQFEIALHLFLLAIGQL